MTGGDPGRGVALVRVAESVVRAAGTELLARVGTALVVQTKTSSTDPVSEADRAAEIAAVGVVRAARPHDGLVGEEGAHVPSTTGLRWVIDPLDGTVNYLYGLPGWCVSVACEEQDAAGSWAAVAACVWDPTHDEVFTAVRGRGARLGGRDLAVNDPVPLERALVATGFSYDPAVRGRQAQVVPRVLGAARDVRRVGSAALDLCWVAAGRLDGYYEDTSQRWDWAAGALVAAEAGAVVTTLVAPEGGSGIMAAGPALHPHLVALVGGSSPT